MDKKILGLDLGVSSIGWTIINSNDDNISIVNMGVRVIPEDPNFHGKFYTGNTASKNLERRTARGARRNNQRYKLRMKRLYKNLIKNDMLPDDTLLKLSAIDLYGLRDRALREKLTLKEIGRVFIHLNQRRGFLSNKKTNSEEESSSEYKKNIEFLESELENKTIGQKLYEELKNATHIIDIVIRERTYLRKTYQYEFDRIWTFQSQFYPDILTGNPDNDKLDNKDTLYDEIRNKTIYYQRPLKSQKGLIGLCQFEKHHKTINTSNPFAELFVVLQKINDLEWRNENYERTKPNKDQRENLLNELFYHKSNNDYKFSITKIKEILGFSKREKIYLNFTELNGSKTYLMLKLALEKAGIKNSQDYLKFNTNINDEKGGLFELWHITYSAQSDEEAINTLIKKFNFTLEQAKIINDTTAYASNYTSLSTKAIKKLLPFMLSGDNYSTACDKAGYDHSGYKEKVKVKELISLIKPNSLRNPVVEQVINNLINVVNSLKAKYGYIDEIRIELSRELRNTAKQRNKISKLNTSNKNNNERIRKKLEDSNLKIINGRDIQRYKLWEETNEKCLYCNSNISLTQLLNGEADREHIIPKSRIFSNNENNFILSHVTCNSSKKQQTGHDYMKSKSDVEYNQYISTITDLYNSNRISKQKFDNLLCKGDEIPTDFVQRMLKDTQYITKEAVKRMKEVCPNVYTTTGQITDFLRSEWELNNLMHEINFSKYESLGLIKNKVIKDSNGESKSIKIIKDWSKRDDHRHHAIDALICALTNPKIIYKLNNLNKIYQSEREKLSMDEIKEIESFLQTEYNIKNFNIKSYAKLTSDWIKCPLENIREQTKPFLESILISYKKTNSKVLTRKKNILKSGFEQDTWVPRGLLHEETIMRGIKQISEVEVKINTNLTIAKINTAVNTEIKEILLNHLKNHNDIVKNAFSSKTLKNTPILYKENVLNSFKVFEYIRSKRVPLGINITLATIDSIIDSKIKELIFVRLKEFENKPKEAFKDLDNNPIWINKEKGIRVKSVRVKVTDKVERVRDGYASSAGNHHALIYIDENGKIREKVVSFWEAVEIGKQNILQKRTPYPIINREDNELGRFLYSMQINDLFVFDFKHSLNPQNDFEMNFFDELNYAKIAPKVYRLQKMTKKSSGTFEVNFRQIFESSINRDLKNITWNRITSNDDFKKISKIKLNNIGQIIKVGE